MNAATTTDSQAIIVPSYEVLREEFDHVCDGFMKGEATDWQFDGSCEFIATADPDSYELIEFGKNVSTQVALNELKSRGLRPATLDELLVYARKHPYKQKEFRIVALGTSCLWGVARRAPFLDWDIRGRYLFLHGYVCDWLYDDCFLAVRV